MQTLLLSESLSAWVQNPTGLQPHTIRCVANYLSSGFAQVSCLADDGAQTRSSTTLRTESYMSSELSRGSQYSILFNPSKFSTPRLWRKGDTRRDNSAIPAISLRRLEKQNTFAGGVTAPATPPQTRTVLPIVHTVDSATAQIKMEISLKFLERMLELQGPVPTFIPLVVSIIAQTANLLEPAFTASAPSLKALYRSMPLALDEILTC